MKNLTLAAVLGIALLFPFSSFASVNVFGVNTPVKKSEFRSNVSGGHIPANLGDTFYIHKVGNDRIEESGLYKNERLVFGVDVNSIYK